MTLSARQEQVLALRAYGLANSEVARVLGISVQTVKNHQTGAFRVLGATNLVEAFGALGWMRLPRAVVDAIPAGTYPSWIVRPATVPDVEREPSTTARAAVG